MASEKENQDLRIRFYNNPLVVGHIKAHGTPKSVRAFRELVALGTSETVDGEKGAALVACLGQIAFANHVQQINVMDKISGQMIVSIPR